jgi:proteasome lid subunit RPN8/RPN11
VDTITPPGDIRIRERHWGEMHEYAEAGYPEEVCGILAGSRRLSRQVYPIENTTHSPVKFSMDPQQLVRALLEMEEAGHELLAIYHTHPGGLPLPSQTDINEALYPDAVQLIWHRVRETWNCRAFMIWGGTFSEVPIKIED